MVKSGSTRAYSRWQTRSRAAALLLVMALLAIVVAPGALAAPRPTNLQGAVPTITSINIVNGQLVASGFVSALIKGTTYTAPFSGVPIDISLVPGQFAGTCPVLDLRLGPINVNLLGLVIQTSPICLTITALSGGGLLGDLLCQVGQLLQAGIPLGQILNGVGGILSGVPIPGLTPTQITSLLGGLTNLFNGALQRLLQATLTLNNVVNQGHTCTILTLSLGPLDLTLLGLNVHLDNCANGPVTVTITAVTGQGNLLGNLLCELVGGNLLSLGATLQQLLNGLLGLLTG
jgi:hypothetical protein